MAYFGGTISLMDPPKSRIRAILLMPGEHQAFRPSRPIATFAIFSFFDISRYLTDKYFDMVWGCRSLGTPQNQVFKQLNLGCHFVDINRYLVDKHFGVVWGYPSLGDPSNEPPKSNFLKGSS